MDGSDGGMDGTHGRAGMDWSLKKEYGIITCLHFKPLT